MLVEITKLERGTKQSAKGKDLTGLFIEGTKYYQGAPDGEWKKFLMDWKDSEFIAAFESIGVGNRAEIKNVKDGQYWNIVSVAPAGQGGAPATTTSTPPTTAAPAATTTQSSGPASSGAGFRKPEEIIREGCLEQALEFAAILVNSPENFKKLLPASKLTANLLLDGILSAASKFETYVTEGNKDVTKSSAADLQKPAEAPPVDDTPPPTEDDDIPF